MLDELRGFLAAAEAGTFTAAARRVHLSQPAFTAAMARLEDRVGARLFDRGPGGARLTASGRALVPWAEQALASVERGLRAVADVEHLAAGEIRLAGGSTACAVWWPPVLTAFHREFPQIHLSLRELRDAEIRRGVEGGDIDLGVVSGEGSDAWVEDALVLVAAPGADTAHLRHLTSPPGTHHRTCLDAAFPEASIAMELTSLAAVRAHAEAGLGVALLSRAAAAESLGAGRLREVPDPRTPIRRTLSLVHAGLARCSPATLALRARLLARADDLRRPV